MQYADRADEPAPACLSDERSAQARETLLGIFTGDTRLVAQTRISMSRLAVEDPELDLAVSRLFRGRCAFCDADEPIQPYRFRPGEEAGPSDAAPPDDADRSHLYYAWLVNAWQNIYAICAGCRPNETSIFPVIGRRCRLPGEDEVRLYSEKPVGLWRGEIAERPLFLDPCGNEDFRRNLAALPNGELVALSSRGDATIQHFNLNRGDLVGRRALTLRRYLDDLLEKGRARDSVLQSFAFPVMEFGGDWFILLYQLALKLGGGGGGRPTLSRKRIGQYYNERFARPDFADRVEQAFNDLLDHPGQLLDKQAKPVAPPRGEARPLHFSIANFKALEKVEIALNPSRLPIGANGAAPATAPALVILGENAAGKSSILEAIALALAPQEARDDLSLDATRFMLNPEWMGSPAGTPPREGSVEVVYENGMRSATRIAPGFAFAAGADMPRIPVFAYGAFRLYLKAGKKARASSAIRSLFEPNYVLPNPEVWLATLRGKPLFEEVARALKAILAVDQKVDVIEIDPRTGECALRMSDDSDSANPLTIRTPLSAVSSGFRSVLAMVCDVMRGLVAAQDQLSASLAKARAVVLIDEVEAHLHPKWKMRIIQGLREALPNVTFIMTTHDPLCLRGLSADEVRVFRRVRRTANPKPRDLPTYVEQLDELPALGALTVEQLLTSDLFQLHTTDAPELEDSFARAGDLLARQAAGMQLDGADADALSLVRAELRAQIGKAVPIGSTDVERLIQEAVEDYLVRRRTNPPAVLTQLRDDTRARIVAALELL